MAKPKVIILATGGTIAGVGAAGKTAGYVPAALTAEQLISAVPEVLDRAEIETIQGTTRRGVLIGDGKELDGVHLEVSPGVEQVFPHDTVRKMRPIPKGR